jgi:transposase
MNRILAIDLGVNCLAACYTLSKFSPMLFRSQPLTQLQRSIQFFLHQKHEARLSELLAQRDQLIIPTFECISFHIVNISKMYKINKIIVGDGFVNHSIEHVFPFHKLYSQIEQKSRLAQITTLLVDEQFTSKVDALSQEDITYKKKYQGVRKGNVYYRSNGDVIHADVNASINILRKHIETEQNKLTIKKYITKKTFPIYIDM